MLKLYGTLLGVDAVTHPDGVTVTATPYPAIFSTGTGTYSRMASVRTTTGSWELSVVKALGVSYLVECPDRLAPVWLHTDAWPDGSDVNIDALSSVAAGATPVDTLTLAEVIEVAMPDALTKALLANPDLIPAGGGGTPSGSAGGDLSGTYPNPTVEKVGGVTASTFFKTVVNVADAAAFRTAIGAGTSNLALGTTSTTAKAGNYVPAWSEVTGKPATFAPTAHAASHAAAGSDPVTLTSAQLSDLTEVVQDIVGALIVAGTGVTVSYNDAAGTFTINSTASGGTTDPEVVRDVIGAAMVAGAGIQLTVNDAGDTITVASTAVLPTRQIVAGTGLTGGGDLSADRTLAVAYGTTAGTAAQGNDSRLSDARTPSGAAGGGLAGTYPNPTVAALRGVTVSATAPTAGQVLTASSGTAAAWTTPAAGAGDATTTAKGVVQLAGDLAGTAAAPTVAKVDGTIPAATGLALLGAATAAAAKTTLALTKADVGLGSVDNTADTAKVFAGAQITSGTVAYARLPVGTAVNTVAAGDDSRFTNSRTPTAHASTHASGGSDPVSITAAQVTDSTATGRSVLTAADAAAARAVLGIAPIPTFVVATTATSNSTTTPTNCAGLSLSGLAAGLYEFDLYVRGQSAAATTGVQVGLNWAGSGATPTVRGLGTNLDAGAPVWSTPDDADTSTTLTPGNAPAASSPFLAASFTGMLRVSAGGMSGPVNVTVASEVAGSQVQVLPDSFIRYRRIAN